MSGALLNIGSGQRPFPKPWTNIDIQEKWNPDIVADGATMNLESDSADIIVLHHTLEHYGCGEAGMLIRNCCRILAPGGSLLVFVPDMVALAHMWTQGRITTQVYMTSVYGAYMNDEADRHKFGYDWLSLRGFLEGCAKWSMVQLFNWRDIPGADLARDIWILAVECKK